jgi:hypothetical protein
MERPTCTSHAPAAEILDKSSARILQTAQIRVTMAYAHGPLMLHINRRIFDTPLEDRLQARTSGLVAEPRQCCQLSITALARLGHKFVPATTTSVLTSLSLVYRPPTQSFVNSRLEIVRSNFLVTRPVTSAFSAAFAPEHCH